MFEELSADIRRWTAPHPEWRPRVAWAQEVACFAVSAGEDLVLVDPLAPADEEPFWAELDRLVADERLEVSVHGHPSVSERLGSDVPLSAIEPGEPLPAGAEAFAIGKPRRRETPIHLPSARALTLQPLLELDVENVLVTHGPPVIGDGRDRLRRALKAPPWSMRSG